MQFVRLDCWAPKGRGHGPSLAGTERLWPQFVRSIGLAVLGSGPGFYRSAVGAGEVGGLADGRSIVLASPSSTGSPEVLKF